MILRQALVLLSVLLQCGAAFAQPRSVTGRVADVNGMPVVGATVVVKEARSSGAITDSDGRYQIRIPEGGKTLLFSFVGYQTQKRRGSGAYTFGRGPATLLHGDRTGRRDGIFADHGQEVTVRWES